MVQCGNNIKDLLRFESYPTLKESTKAWLRSIGAMLGVNSNGWL
jgi:hypothetical protein